MLQGLIAKMAREVTGALVSNIHVPVEPANARDTERVVRQEIAKEITPTIEHLTNNEPFYKSRVTWGALAAIGAGLFGIVGEYSAGQLDLSDFYAGPHAISIYGGVTTLWGRWVATKPIGA